MSVFTDSELECLRRAVRGHHRPHPTHPHHLLRHRPRRDDHRAFGHRYLTEGGHAEEVPAGPAVLTCGVSRLTGRGALEQRGGQQGARGQGEHPTRQRRLLHRCAHSEGTLTTIASWVDRAMTTTVSVSGDGFSSRCGTCGGTQT